MTSDLLLDWGLALDSLHQPDQALEKLRQAVAMEPMAEGYINIAKIYAERSQWPEALAALDTAQKINAASISVYAFRGKIYLKTDRVCDAITPNVARSARGWLKRR